MSFNHFDYVPSSINKSRSVFRFNKAIATSAYVGWLYPMCKPVRMMPGSTLKLNLAMEIRTGALIAPLMDELECDVFAFNVPNRIVWEHWKQFLGAVDDVLFDNLSNYNIPSFKYSAPTISGRTDADAWVWNQMLACHFELPYVKTTTSLNAPTVSALPFRGYDFIWNEFFRPEQLIQPILFSKTDAGYSGANMKFTTTNYSFIDSETILPVPTPGAGASSGINTGGCILPTYRVHRSLWTSVLPKPSLESPSLLSAVSGFPYQTNSGGLSISTSGTITAGTGNQNTDWSNVVLTVNQLRETLLLQGYYDTLNRAGSRYDEIMRNLFHTTAADAIIDIPELIVHKRFTIYRNQVVATAETIDAEGSTVNPVGSQGAFIDTIIKDSFFTKSTTEHGFIHMLYTIRPARIRMASGIEPEWRQLAKFDQYYPQFDGMGDVARNKDEVYYSTASTENAQKVILGYQEYGAEWKYQRNSATGFLDPYSPLPIGGYSLVEKLTNAPTLNDGPGFPGYFTCWSEFEAMGRCLAISSPLISPQFVLDIRLVGEVVHPMPVYNIPGMGDVL